MKDMGNFFGYCTFHQLKSTITQNMGSKQYGVDHLNMEINKFTLERKVYHSLNQSECRTSVMIIFRVNFTRY